MNNLTTEQQEKNYWTGGWTHDNLRSLAIFQNWQTGANINLLSSIKQIREDIIDNGNIGGTEMQKIVETDDNFVFISKDGDYKVLNVINKKDITKSTSIEL